MNTRRQLLRLSLVGTGSVFAALDQSASTLAEAGRRRNLLMGCAVSIPHLDDQPYARLIARQCSIVVAENSMKWRPIHPEPERYDFTAADRLVNFASEHGLAIRGHNLCWHEANPAWLAATATHQNAEHILTSHIQTVVSRYAGKIHSWDVVNEAIDPKDNQPNGLRNSLWLQLLGPRYLEIAFRAAHAADPHALLTYNDYGIEYDSPGDAAKRAAILSLLRRLKKANVPLGAIGVQSHLKAPGDGHFGDDLRSFLASTLQLGLKSMITELDVDGATTDAAAAEVYRDYLNLMLPQPSMVAVLTWGITDRYSWLNSRARKAGRPMPRPLPFDENLRLTAIYRAYLQALLQQNRDQREHPPKTTG